MALITLFSAPKAFTEPRIAMFQRNAIQSWKRLADTDVLLLGEEDGLAEAASELAVGYSSKVAKNPSRVPLISSMFELARELSNSPLLGVINTDIMLMSDFAQAARQLVTLRAAGVLGEPFVAVSRRWDLELPEPIDFQLGWEERLQALARAKGRLHRPTGSDIFLFPRECYLDVPAFAIGRGGWDNWMIYHARRQGWAIVDMTPSVMIVHQNHDYGHLPGARPHYDHPDTAVNAMLAGGQAATRYTLLDATQELIQGRLTRPSLSLARFTRGLELLLRRLFFFLPGATLESIARPKRWQKRLGKILGKAPK